MSKYIKKQKRFAPANEINSLSQILNIQETELYDKVTKLEEQIHSKLFDAKKYKNNYNCQHTNVQISKNIQQKICKTSDETARNQIFSQIASNFVCEFNMETNYYDKFWKLFLLNEMNKKKIDDIKQSIHKINDISSDVAICFNERQFLLKSSFHKGYKKYKVLKSEDYFKTITRKIHVCPFPQCQKHYNTEVSLNTHMKTKHNAGQKSERQQKAEIYWKCFQEEKIQPELQIIFAPGYLEEYGYLTGRIDKKDYEFQQKMYGWKQGQVNKKKLQLFPEDNLNFSKIIQIDQ